MLQRYLPSIANSVAAMVMLSKVFTKLSMFMYSYEVLCCNNSQILLLNINVQFCFGNLNNNRKRDTWSGCRNYWT